MSKAQTSKQEIFDRAIELFSSEGFENVTMRGLARHCNLSPGAFYYHFKNKEDLIFYFYQASLERHIARGESYLENAPKNLTEVMRWICHDRFEEFLPYKEMLKPLIFSFDAKSPLSPWAKESQYIRKNSIMFFRKIATHCMNIKNEQLIDTLARALWMQHLMIVGMWLVSEKEVNKGELLLEESVKVWKWIPTFLKIPGSGKTLTKISQSLERIGIWESYET